MALPPRKELEFEYIAVVVCCGIFADEFEDKRVRRSGK